MVDTVLETEKKEVIGSMRSELASVNRQLLLSREETENLKIQNNTEIRY